VEEARHAIWTRTRDVFNSPYDPSVHARFLERADFTNTVSTASDTWSFHRSSTERFWAATVLRRCVVLVLLLRSLWLLHLTAAGFTRLRPSGVSSRTRILLYVTTLHERFSGFARLSRQSTRRARPRLGFLPITERSSRRRSRPLARVRIEEARRTIWTRTRDVFNSPFDSSVHARFLERVGFTNAVSTASDTWSSLCSLWNSPGL
jgi:hypothetical protein